MSEPAEAASAPLLEISGARATIRLNRPKHLNRLQSEDLGDLIKLFDRIEADPAIRVLVLTGTGRAFSAGYDLGSIAERAASAPAEQTAGSAFEVVANRLEDLSMPTICRLNGGVYGGSTDLALACDFRIGVDTAEMFMPAARLGLHYYTSGIKRYVSRLGADNARKLFLTAQKIEASEMLRIGYLTAVVPAESLDEDAVIVEGYAEYATWRPHLAYLRDPYGDPDVEMELDGVGGVSILAKARVFRAGVHFPAFSFERHAETEGFGKMARRMKFSVFTVASRH